MNGTDVVAYSDRTHIPDSEGMGFQINEVTDDLYIVNFRSCAFFISRNPSGGKRKMHWTIMCNSVHFGSTASCGNIQPRLSAWDLTDIITNQDLCAISGEVLMANEVKKYKQCKSTYLDYFVIKWQGKKMALKLPCIVQYNAPHCRDVTITGILTCIRCDKQRKNLVDVILSCDNNGVTCDTVPLRRIVAYMDLQSHSLFNKLGKLMHYHNKTEISHSHTPQTSNAVE